MSLVEEHAPLPIAPNPALPPPARPKQTFHELILPTGRAVRLRDINTADYLDAKEHAASDAGDPTKRPDPRGIRYARALDMEVLARAVVAYTDRIDWTETLNAQADAQMKAWASATQNLPAEARPVFEYKPDVEALLSALPETAWHATTPLDLLTGGPLGLVSVFSDVGEWEVLTRTMGDLLLPRRNMAGFVGKVQRVAR